MLVGGRVEAIGLGDDSTWTGDRRGGGDWGERPEATGGSSAGFDGEMRESPRERGEKTKTNTSTGDGS